MNGFLPPVSANQTIPSVAHDVGDTLSVNFNYQWRVFIVGLLSRLEDKKYWSGSEIEKDNITQMVADMMTDFYD